MIMVGDASKARLIAVFIDHLIAFALTLLVVAFVPDTIPSLKAVLFFLTYLAYFFLMEALWSRTVGKLFQGLVIRKLDGTRCDWKAALIRSALRILEVNPLLLGGLPAGLVIIASERKQRIGDILAGTLVVSTASQWDDNSVQPASAEPML
jgi:uncharacterized RDD family membrane protein YckC